jgi:hypothetical protein
MTNCDSRNQQNQISKTCPGGWVACPDGWMECGLKKGEEKGLGQGAFFLSRVECDREMSVLSYGLIVIPSRF